MLLINANQLENTPEGTAAYLDVTGLPYLVDPMLWRFQVPSWWRNTKGNVKRNYSRLASRYCEGTAVRLAEGPLLDSVATIRDWRRIAANVVLYQRERLREQPDLFNPDGIRPQAIVAPAIVTSTPEQDRLNRLLADSTMEAAGAPVVVTLVLPRERLEVPSEVTLALREVAADGIAAYLIWTPAVTESLLLTDQQLFAGLLSVTLGLAERGVPVVHLHGSYTTAALRPFGMAGVVHHMGWVDKGEPADEQRGAIRSCQTYVTGIRHCARFHEAEHLGRSLGESEYLDRYCGCRFCAGAFQSDQHPLDLLLEDQPAGNSRRRTPTSRAATANMWHYLLARRQEVEAFRTEPVLDVVERDIERAAALAGRAQPLERLAARLRTA